MTQPNRSDLVYDIGLHLGEDTAYALAKGYRVVAVEADPDLADKCAVRFEDEIAAGRLIIIQGAASSKPGPLRFFRNDSSVWGTLHEGWKKRNELLGSGSVEITVNAVSVTDLVSRYGCPYYMKLDIEGGELEVLREMLACRIDVPETISIESEKVSFSRLRAEFRLLRKLGYRKFKVVQQATIPTRTIETSTIDGRPLAYRFEKHASGPFGADLSGPWLPAWLALAKYVPIFALYKLVGDDGYWNGTFLERALRRALQPICNYYLPGWYDTHATR